MPKKVLFFLNNLNRTGSETLMFQFICELQKVNSVEIGIVLMEKGGDLVAELPSEIPVFYLEKQFSLFDKIAFHSGKDVIASRLNQIQKDFNANIWYFNTIANIDLLRYKSAHSVKAWVHVHELLYNFESLPKSEFDLLLSQADQIIACSSLVKELFASIYEKQVVLINSTINPELYQAKRINSTSKKIKVVSAGTICYRKGADLFLEMASLAPKDQFEFIWLGSSANNAFSEWVFEKNKISKVVKFISTPSTEAYQQELAQADLFLSTSREESMGLVMLEAAALKIPILALNSGGAELIVNDKNGVICYDSRPKALLEALLKLAGRLADFQTYPPIPFEFQTELTQFLTLFKP